MNYNGYFEQALTASHHLAQLKASTINLVLRELADYAVAKTDFLLAENQKDLNLISIDDSKYDRLKLTPGRIKDIANEIINVAGLQSPIGDIIEERGLENGLHLTKMRVPLGVVGVIYEARPNVTFDVFALCFKTGNACVLKGGSDARYSNTAIISLIHEVLSKHGIHTYSATLLPPEREATSALLTATGLVDVIIPRGSQQLIDFVRENSKVPVIETGAGIVHIYVDADADLKKAASIIDNAKTRRVSVCNALDCLIINSARLNDLPAIVEPLVEKQVQLFADEQAYTALQNSYSANLLNKADPKHYGTEFLSLKLAIKTVDNLDEALKHIQQYSSKHSEAIITENTTNAEIFLNAVDAAAVYLNASTAFTDGAQFGLGAEIGISTQKLHARGPMGLKELTSYKWIVRGEGQIRPS